MSTATGTMNKPRRAGGWVAVAVVVAVVVGIPVSITLVNDAAARDVESQLRSLPLPNGTELVESTSQAAKIVGNGNGMQYLGALLLRSDQNTAELQKYYDAQTTSDKLDIRVAPSGSLDEFHGASGFIDDPAADGMFIVYAWGNTPGDVFEEFDLRGH